MSMDKKEIEAYRKAFVVDPQPSQRYRFVSNFNVTLFYESFDEAVAFFAQVLGPAGYVEGENTIGWRIGAGWLTLLRGKQGNPKNVEVMFEVGDSAEAEKLQQAFIAAGASGPAPSNELMYDPVRYCPFVDPFGIDFLIFARQKE